MPNIKTNYSRPAETLSKDELQAYAKGYARGLTGKLPAESPYRINSELDFLYIRGYNDGYIENQFPGVQENG